MALESEAVLADLGELLLLALKKPACLSTLPRERERKGGERENGRETVKGEKAEGR